MKHLFKNWNLISNKIISSDLILILSDYDGTLTPIVGSPEKAILNNKTRNLLKKLKSDKKFLLGIISGRKISDVKKHVNIRNIYYAGNHGFEIEGPNFKFTFPVGRKIKNNLKKVFLKLRRRLNKINGVLCENKGFTVTVHYRLAKAKDYLNIKKIIHELAKPLVTKKIIKLSSGKKVIELKPTINWHKGKAIKFIIDRISNKINVLPLIIYLGDDKTDEDAFKAIQKKGIAVLIGKKKQSKAKYFLNDPNEVCVFLRKLLLLSNR